MAAPWRFLPCSNCCDCVIFTDDFNRTNIGNDWQQKSGTWSIESNRLKGCGSGTQMLWTGPEELTDNFSVQVQVTFAAEGQKARIFFGGDGSRAFYAEFEVGPIINPGTYYAYYLFYTRIFDPDGAQIGATSEHTLNSGSYETLSCFLCIWSDGDDYRILTAGLLYGSTLYAGGRFGKVDVASFPGGHVGLGGDDADTCLLFDDLKLARPEGQCIPCKKQCAHIKWDEKPSCLKITFEGFGNGPCMLWGDWEGCHCLNRTIYLADYGGCSWRVSTVWADYCFNASSLYTGGMAYWEADVRFTDGHYWLYVTLYAGYHGARTTFWRADLGEDKPEAMTLDVIDFELVQDLVSDICDLGNVTLHAVAVDAHECPPQQNRCLACGPQCGEYPPEIRLRTSGFGGANDGDFILGPGFVDWYHDECVWSYSGDVTWYVRFIYDNQSPSINIFVDHGGYWDGIYGSQTWPIDCTNFTITLTDGSKTAIISNV